MQFSTDDDQANLHLTNVYVKLRYIRLTLDHCLKLKGPIEIRLENLKYTNSERCANRISAKLCMELEHS